MKKFTKILVAILALACMVSVMAVSASAAVKSEVYVGASNNGQGFVFDSNANPKLQTGKVDVKVPEVQVPQVTFTVPGAPVPGYPAPQNCGCTNCQCGPNCGCQQAKPGNKFPGEYKDWDYIMSHQPNAQTAPKQPVAATQLK